MTRDATHTHQSSGKRNCSIDSQSIYVPYGLALPYDANPSIAPSFTSINLFSCAVVLFLLPADYILSECRKAGVASPRSQLKDVLDFRGENRDRRAGEWNLIKVVRTVADANCFLPGFARTV